MIPSFRAFHARLLDYAGLFPPARLPLDEAIKSYARYRQSPDAWMLSRFIVPAARLGELSAYRDELFVPSPGFAFIVLCGGGDDEGEYGAALKEAAKETVSFRERCGPSVSVEAFELRLPASAGDAAEVTSAVAIARDILSPERAFFEVPQGERWRPRLDAAIEALSDVAGGVSGLKLRCGGAGPGDTPTVDIVAAALSGCRDAQVPFKATAGLHHPVRHFREKDGVTMHGFFNVFGAGILGHARGLSAAELAEVVAEKDAGAFRFSRGGFAWRDSSASVAEIEDARENAVVSFGSCSFDEPREDLRALGLLS